MGKSEIEALLKKKKVEEEKKGLSEETRAILRNPEVFLPEYGVIVGQDESQLIPWDPNAICPAIGTEIPKYYNNSGRDAEGRRKWLVVMASRQSGKSSTAAMCSYCVTAYRPGTKGYTIADYVRRSDDIFRHISVLHDNIPEEVREPTIPHNELKKLTFLNDASYQCRSGDMDNVGLGMSPDSLHLSECPFWRDMESFWTLILPAIRNRREAYVTIESTPSTTDAPSAEWFMNLCSTARENHHDPASRLSFLFVPFYKSWLNERNWNPKWVLTAEEEKLLKDYGPGPKAKEAAYHAPAVPWMTYRNLAFIRETLLLDPEIKKNPQLFWTYYPVDPITCWGAIVGGPLPMQYLERLMKLPLTPWDPGLRQVQYYIPEPREGAVYVVSIDPAGWTVSGDGDQASIQVMELWADKVEQAATFSSNKCSPKQVADMAIELAKKYANAWVICETNGVGEATSSFLYEAFILGALPNLWFRERGLGKPPGIYAGSGTIDAAMSRLVMIMEKKLILHDQETMYQLQTYKNDKAVAPSRDRRIQHPDDPGRSKRRRHHWDRVSALLWGAYLIGEPVLSVGLAPYPYAADGTTSNVRIYKASDLGPADLASFRMQEFIRLQERGMSPEAASAYVYSLRTFRDG